MTDQNTVPSESEKQALNKRAQEAYARLYMNDMETQYKAALVAGAKGQMEIFNSPKHLLDAYHIAAAADLNGDGTLSGTNEQSALIAYLTTLDVKPFSDLKQLIEQSCTPPMGEEAKSVLSDIGQNLYRGFYSDKKLAEAYKPDGSTIAAATDAYLAAEKQAREASHKHEKTIAKGPLSDEQYKALLGRLDALDAQKDTALAASLMRSFTQYPQLKEAAEALPKLGELSPLPADQVCKETLGTSL